MPQSAPLHTRKDYEQLLFSIREPLTPFYAQAGLDVGDTGACYPRQTVNMEAFLRPLWGFVSCWAGGSSTPEMEEIYRQGFAAGTDSESPTYWGGFWNGDQRFVDMASIAYGLLFAPQKLWDPLNEKEKKNLAQWLSAINRYELPVCNWQFFRVLVNVALKKLGCSYDEERMQESLRMIDTFYLADGWYQDGDSGQRDYYGPFALHFYGLMYSVAMKKEDPKRCEIYRQRALEFARQFVYWFDEDGAALPYGRSLTYRFAQAAFFSACVLCGLEPFTLGQMKGIIGRHLRWWMQKPIFDRAGLLTIGYGYPNLNMAEKYNAPGSPYWALKTFAVLALPADHPFWQAEEEPLPNLREQKLLSQAHMLIHRYPGHTTAYVPGVYGDNNLGHFHEKYGKFAYDTKFGFSVAKSQDNLAENAPDSMLAFVIHGQVYIRKQCIDYALHENAVYSTWSPYPGIVVETEITPTKNGHLRRHMIGSTVDCTVYDCAFSVQTDVPGVKDGTNEYSAFAMNDLSSCEITDAGRTGKPLVIGSDPNTNLMYPNAIIPAIAYAVKPGKQIIQTIVTAVWEEEDHEA